VGLSRQEKKIPYVYGRLRRRGRNDVKSIRLVVPSSSNDLGAVETSVTIHQPRERFENPKPRIVRRDVYLDKTHRPLPCPCILLSGE
jgi:hypothetical protein